MKNFYIIFSSKIFLLCFQLIIQSYLAWSLGPAGRGEYAIALMFSLFLASVLVVGADYAGTYLLASKQFNLSESVWYTLIFIVLCSIVANVVGYYIIQLPIEIFKKAELNTFFLATVSIPFFLYAESLLRILTGVFEYKLYAIMVVLRTVFFFVCILIFEKICYLGVDGIFYGKIASDLMIIFIIIYLLKSKFGLHKVHIKLSKIKIQFSYGIRNYVGKLSNTINTRMGVLIIAFFATKEEIGFFSMAVLLVSKIAVIPDSVSLILIPKISKNSSEIKKMVMSCVRIIGLISGIALAILFFLSHYIVVILFGPDYLSVAELIPLLIIGYWFNSMAKGFASYLTGTNHPGLNSISYFAGMVVNLAVMIVLLPLLGISGASISVSINYCVHYMLVLFFFIKISNVSLFDILLFKKEDLNILKQITSKFAK